MDNWCAAKNLPRGACLTMDQVWTLSQLWYHDRLHLDFNGRTLDEAAAIFRQLDLTEPFWYLPQD